MAICDRFRCLPSQALAEPVEVLELIETENAEHAAVEDEGW